MELKEGDDIQKDVNWPGIRLLIQDELPDLTVEQRGRLLFSMMRNVTIIVTQGDALRTLLGNLAKIVPTTSCSLH